MKKHYASIQIVRAILFLGILAFHSGIRGANIGWGGVEFFFVISAFWSVNSLYGKKSFDIKQKFWGRIKRLYPTYLVIVGGATLFAFIRRILPYDLIIHIFSGQNFLWMMTGYSSPMQPLTAHTWTLSIEVWIGALWLILLRFLNNKQFKIAMYVSLILAIFVRCFMMFKGMSEYVISLCPIAHMDAFACGSLVAISIKENKSSLKPKRAVLIAGLVGCLGIIGTILKIAKSNHVSILQGYELLSYSKNYLNDFLTGNIYLYLALMATAILYLCISFENRKIVKVNWVVNMLLWIGDNSYGLYLFHWPILCILKQLSNNALFICLLTLICTIIVTKIFDGFYTYCRLDFRRVK